MSPLMFTLAPIGQIAVRDGSFALQIDPAFAPALLGLDGFSHLNVFWWSHQLDTPDLRRQTRVPQPYRKAPAELGLFATRSPLRPNPICLSVAPVIQVDAARGWIELAYIDAADGTPLLDIKPYLPCTDRVRQVETPDWNRHWPAWYEDSAEFDWEAEFVSAR